MPLACAASSARAIAAQDRERLGERQPAVALDERVERLAVEELHHVVLAAVLELRRTRRCR